MKNTNQWSGSVHLRMHIEVENHGISLRHRWIDIIYRYMYTDIIIYNYTGSNLPNIFGASFQVYFWGELPLSRTNILPAAGILLPERNLQGTCIALGFAVLACVATNVVPLNKTASLHGQSRCPWCLLEIWEVKVGTKSNSWNLGSADLKLNLWMGLC